jgi:hypothetical protein
VSKSAIIIAILARWRDQRQALRGILQKVGSLAKPERERALRQLLVLAGLRGIKDEVSEEARRMAVFIDIAKTRSWDRPIARAGRRV